MNDEIELFNQAKSGDRDALEKLLIGMQDQLYRTAYLQVNNEQDALDVVQETALQVTRSVNKINEPKFFKTWVISILINVVHQLYRSREKNKLILLKDERSQNDEPDLQMDLLSAINELPDTQREVIILLYYNDLPLNDIATILQVPVGTVKSRVSRGLEKLRQKGGYLDEYRLTSGS